MNIIYVCIHIYEYYIFINIQDINIIYMPLLLAAYNSVVY